MVFPIFHLDILIRVFVEKCPAYVSLYSNCGLGMRSNIPCNCVRQLCLDFAFASSRKHFRKVHIHFPEPKGVQFEEKVYCVRYKSGAIKECMVLKTMMPDEKSTNIAEKQLEG